MRMGIIIAIAMAVTQATGVADSIASPPTTHTYTFRTSTFTLSVDSKGTMESFASCADGIEHASVPRGPFMRVRPAGGNGTTWVSITSLMPSTTGVFTATFEWLGTDLGGSTSAARNHANASVRITVVQSTGAQGGEFEYIQFNVIEVAGSTLDTLEFAVMPLSMPRNGNGRCQNGWPMAPCDFLAHASTAAPTLSVSPALPPSTFSAVVVPLSPLVSTAVDRTDPSVQILTATSIRQLPLVPPMKVGLAGKSVSAALWAGPSEQLKSALAAAESTFKQLPSPRINGVRAKDSGVMLQGYILEEGANATATIAEAKASGLTYVMLLGFTETDGTYNVNRKLFPEGDASVKAFVDALHAAGLKVGMHFLSAHISKTDPLVGTLSNR